MEEVQSRVTLVQEVKNTFYIRLARPITEIDDFSEELQALMAAGEQDTVHLEIVSGGGSLDTCIMMRRALAQCKAKTIAWIGPTCASAATAIALGCDEWEVDDMSSFMVHTGSFAPGWGKARDVEAATLHNVRQIERFVKTVYDGFLSEEEIHRVLDGKEMYIDGEDLVERLSSFATKRQEAMFQQYEEMMAQGVDPEDENE